ncbi:MAG: hypothetical protein HY791_13025 [Deltaproteobacteria bacterium]|nr:hypothetical protein [Deltaproteobacteria bacterium]
MSARERSRASRFLASGAVSVGEHVLTFLAFGIAASTPLGAIWVLGSMLVIQARVARGLPVREWVPGRSALSKATLFLSVSWLMLRAPAFALDLAVDASVLESPKSSWLASLSILAHAGLGIHVMLAACRRSLTALFTPLENLDFAVSADLLRELRLTLRAGVEVTELVPRLWLGVCAALGAMAWLIGPTTLLLASEGPGPRNLASLVGALALAPVLYWVPFLEVQFARRGRFRALFDPASSWATERRAPGWSLLALIATYVSASLLAFVLTLTPPEDARWVTSPLFILLVLPPRLLVAFAVARAERAVAAPRPLLWVGRLLAAPAVALYVFVVFFGRTFEAHGRLAALAHPALLLPI